MNKAKKKHRHTKWRKKLHKANKYHIFFQNIFRYLGIALNIIYSKDGIERILNVTVCGFYVSVISLAFIG
jgi:hypothetical protein